MEGLATRRKDWMVRPTTVATARFIVASLPIRHKSGISRPAA
jgi:hypothetical protein